MKKSLSLIRIVIIVLSIFYVFCAVGIPVISVMTVTDGAGTAHWLWNDMRERLAAFTPLYLLALIPLVWLNRFMNYKLSCIDKKRFMIWTYVLAGCEIIVLCLLICIIISAQQSVHICI